MKEIKLIPLVILFLSYSPFLSQKEENGLYKSYISFIINVNQQKSFRGTVVGEPQIKFPSHVSGEFGFEYHQFFNKNVEISLGIKEGAIPYFEKTSINKNDSLIDYVENGTYNDYDKHISNWYFNPTFSVKYNSFAINKLQLYFETGIGLNFIVPYDNSRIRSSLGDINNTKTILYYESNTKSHGKWINPSFYFKIGGQKRIKRQLIKLGIIYNFMPNYIRKGSYKFINIANPSYGDLEVRMSYIGLELSYGLGFNKSK